MSRGNCPPSPQPNDQTWRENSQKNVFLNEAAANLKTAARFCFSGLDSIPIRGHFLFATGDKFS